jgi:hypothetical protein
MLKLLKHDCFADSISVIESMLNTQLVCFFDVALTIHPAAPDALFIMLDIYIRELSSQGRRVCQTMTDWLDGANPENPLCFSVWYKPG